MSRAENVRKVPLAAALILLVNGQAGFCAASGTPLPADCGYYNAAEHGVIPDDGRDDVEALGALIRKRFAEQDRYASPPFIYLPAGTYNLSGPVEARAEPGSWSDGWLSGFILVGQSREKTVLRLEDRCPAFADPHAPTALLKTGSEGRDDNESGWGNQAFRHYVMNLTLHTGSGNPGAIGLDYLANNRGAVENVTIVSGDGDGKAGIAMNRSWPGPALLKHVLIDGFDRGVDVDNHYDYSMTLEHITLRNQRECGIFVHNNNLFIRGLQSDNAVTALAINNVHGYVVLLDATLNGTNAAAPAIVNAGRLLARNVRCEGYDTALVSESGQTILADDQSARIAEYVSHEAISLFDSPKRTLDLPVKETPVYDQPDTTLWVNAVDYGATPDRPSDDDAEALQAAVDRGGEIVYLPSGAYHIGKTLVIRSAVRKIMGMQSSIRARDAAAVEPLFRFEGDKGSGVILEHLRLAGGIEHASTASLTIRHCDHEGYYNSVNGTGDLFVEDVIGKPYRILHPQHAWMRQVNTEFDDNPLIENHGGTVWILGHKTEGEPTLIKTVNGATELLGGHFRALKNPAAAMPAIVAIDAAISLSFAMEYRTWPIRVSETRNGETRTLTESSNRIVLYTGYDTNQRAVRRPCAVAGAGADRAVSARSVYDIRGRKLPGRATPAERYSGVYILGGPKGNAQIEISVMQ